MTVVSLKAEKPGIIKVTFSDGSSSTLAINYVPDVDFSFWESGQEITSAEEEIIRFANSCYRAETVAYRLIARAEQHSHGLRVKLERRGFETSVVKAVVSHFLERNLLDDSRFAERWIHSRISLGKAPSPRWLLVSLGKRGIGKNVSGEAIRKALDPETEYRMLLKYLDRIGSTNYRKGNYIKAKLKNEGFSYAVLNRFFDNN